tara:strand:+ start:123 stop:329 length:207 start_codon:yes stop_codon:yes gene_type:complete
MSEEKRYIIVECPMYQGSYLVIDKETDLEIRFHNLASARTHVRMKEKKEPKYCDVCGCDPCDCHWGNY